jgi:hypothetical protein
MTLVPPQNLVLIEITRMNNKKLRLVNPDRKFFIIDFLLKIYNRITTFYLSIIQNEITKLKIENLVL